MNVSGANTCAPNWTCHQEQTWPHPHHRPRCATAWLRGPPPTLARRKCRPL